MSRINIMVSSIVNDLLGERESIYKLFQNNNLINLLGAYPYNNQSYSGSSIQTTLKMAQSCDLYILLLNNKFGYETKDGRSATEIEFDAAYKNDPTKILVFFKDVKPITDSRQKSFVNKVCDYYSGYWRSSFKYTHELQVLVQNSFNSWLKERASFSQQLSYLDHFIRLASQRKPEPNALVYYSLKEDYVELEYKVFGKIYIIHFNRDQIYSDFWGCLYQLEEQFINWI